MTRTGFVLSLGWAIVFKVIAATYILRWLIMAIDMPLVYLGIEIARWLDPAAPVREAVLD